jgi:hypothetical protein
MLALERVVSLAPQRSAGRGSGRGVTYKSEGSITMRLLSPALSSIPNGEEGVVALLN